MALAEGTTTQEANIHVGMLTGLFALMQFFFTPLWGRWSDRIGRRPLFLIGLGGYAIFMVLFGIGTNLFMLYAARILGGALSSAVLPLASAYVADVTSETERGKGMAWLGSAIGLGVVVGPALGGLLSRVNWHMKFHFFHFRLGHFHVDDFSIPFFAAALFAVLAFLVTMFFLPESIRESKVEAQKKYFQKEGRLYQKTSLWFIRESSWKLLFLSFLGYFALALFEGTFALHAKQVMQFGPAQMGRVFIVCGLIMAGAQICMVGWLIDRIGEVPLLSFGFGFMGTALILLMTTQTMALILLYAALFALGMAGLNPSLASLVSKRAGKHSGAALGLQTAVINLGQASGPLVGGLLFAWYIHVPYLLTALPLIITSLFIGRKSLVEK